MFILVYVYMCTVYMYMCTVYVVEALSTACLYDLGRYLLDWIGS